MFPSIPSKLTLVRKLDKGPFDVYHCGGCGTEKEIRRAEVKRGQISCGCRIHEARVHGHGRRGKVTPELRAWKGMRSRCHNRNSQDYRHYGGRGIVVCDRWRDSFENFLADMGPRPGPMHTVDRKDNDGPYSPENCRWATKLEQMGNTRRNRNFTFGGKTQCLRRWAAELGVGYDTLYQRVCRAGWSVERAFTTPAVRQSKGGEG